jgi:hypothetical protein
LPHVVCVDFDALGQWLIIIVGENRVGKSTLVGPFFAALFRKLPVAPRNRSRVPPDGELPVQQRGGTAYQWQEGAFKDLVRKYVGTPASSSPSSSSKVPRAGPLRGAVSLRSGAWDPLETIALHTVTHSRMLLRRWEEVRG